MKRQVRNTGFRERRRRVVIDYTASDFRSWLMTTFEKSIGHPSVECPSAYPYLLRKLAVTRPNQVWCAD